MEHPLERSDHAADPTPIRMDANREGAVLAFGENDGSIEAEFRVPRPNRRPQLAILHIRHRELAGACFPMTLPSRQLVGDSATGFGKLEFVPFPSSVPSGGLYSCELARFSKAIIPSLQNLKSKNKDAGYQQEEKRRSLGDMLSHQN